MEVDAVHCRPSARASARLLLVHITLIHLSPSCGPKASAHCTTETYLRPRYLQDRICLPDDRQPRHSTMDASYTMNFADFMEKFVPGENLTSAEVSETGDLSELRRLGRGTMNEADMRSILVSAALYDHGP